VRRIAWGLGIVIVAGVIAYAGMIALFEASGEVVAVRTLDADGKPYDSRVWVVDVDGRAYLRTGNANARWLANLRVRPTVTVTRAGETRTYLATPVEDPVVRELVNVATAAKYGTGESFLRMGMLDPEHTIPVRLDPTTE